MKLIDVKIDRQQLLRNKQRLIDINKAGLYERDTNIFDVIDFENDEFFFTPSLFFYLFDPSGNKNIGIDQLCAGCRSASEKHIDLPVYFDGAGIAHFPGIGDFFYEELSGRTAPGSFLQKEKTLAIKGRELTPLTNNVHTTNKILFPVHLPDVLTIGNKTSFRETPATTLAGASEALTEAIGFLSKHCEEFFSILEMVTKEVILFNSPDHESFAGITYHGAACLNTENKQQDMVFFIDDLSHQCGHIIFNTLTLETEMYLKLPKTTRLGDLTPELGHRTLYGAFHGLFTYSCILYTLSSLFTQTGLLPKTRTSLLGRIGFYLIKFMIDLDAFYKIQHVFAEKGQELYQQFIKTYYTIHEQFSPYTHGFSYVNQPYTFDEAAFLELNERVNILL